MSDEGGLIRSDREVALGELIVALARAAEVTTHAAERLNGRSGAEPLARLAAQRASDRDGLLAAGLEGGVPPSEPDPERAAAAGLLERLRAAISADEVQSVLRTCREAEGQVAEALTAARTYEFPDAVAAALVELAERQPVMRETLAAAERAAGATG